MGAMATDVAIETGDVALMGEDLRHLQVDAGFEARTDRGTLTARAVVAATGPFQHSAIPDLAANLDARSPSSTPPTTATRTSSPDGPVLVVGGVNSGVQIAEELTRTRSVTIAVGVVVVVGCSAVDRVECGWRSEVAPDLYRIGGAVSSGRVMGGWTAVCPAWIRSGRRVVAAGVEAEGWVLVGHERGVGGDAFMPRMRTNSGAG